jgi:hypothetical protein
MQTVHAEASVLVFPQVIARIGPASIQDDPPRGGLRPGSLDAFDRRDVAILVNREEVIRKELGIER